jgi:hypothetical protein
VSSTGTTRTEWSRWAGVALTALLAVLAFTVQWGVVSVGAAYKRSGNYGCRIVAPQGSGTAYITLANGFDANGNPATVSRTAYTLGFGMRLATLPMVQGVWEYLLYVAYSTTHRASLRLDGDGVIHLHVGASGWPYIASFRPVDLGRWRPAWRSATWPAEPRS